MPPTISVLITYYNERELLTECLRSLAAQTQLPDEILIYDDASTYPAAEYVPSDIPAQVIRGDVNGGPARGRNMLLRAATAEYVHFHDADDLFEPTWCAQVGAALEEIEVVFTEIRSFANGKLLSDRVLGLAQLQAEGDLLRFCIRGSMLVPAGTYRRGLLLELGGYRETLWQCEDYDFHIRLAARGVHYRLIDTPLVIIRVRLEGRSSRQLEVWASALQALKLQAKELPTAYGKELAEMAAYVGSQLFKLGARHTASEAFQLAHSLGPPTYARQRRSYRLLASALGPEAAEWISLSYRRLLPEPLRRALVQRGL